MGTVQGVWPPGALGPPHAEASETRQGLRQSRTALDTHLPSVYHLPQATTSANT